MRKLFAGRMGGGGGCGGDAAGGGAAAGQKLSAGCAAVFGGVGAKGPVDEGIARGAGRPDGASWVCSGPAARKLSAGRAGVGGGGGGGGDGRGAAGDGAAAM